MFIIDLRKGVPDFEEFCRMVDKSKTKGGLRKQLEDELVFYEKKYVMNSVDFYEQYKKSLLPDTHDFNLWYMKYELLQEIEG